MTEKALIIVTVVNIDAADGMVLSVKNPAKVTAAAYRFPLITWLVGVIPAFPAIGVIQFNISVQIDGLALEGIVVVHQLRQARQISGGGDVIRAIFSRTIGVPLRVRCRTVPNENLFLFRLPPRPHRAKEHPKENEKPGQRANRSPPGLPVVPYIIIGNQSWNGYDSSYDDEIISKIESEYKTNPSERYDIMNYVDGINLSDASGSVNSYASDIAVVIAIVLVVAAIGGGIWFARKKAA